MSELTYDGNSSNQKYSSPSALNMFDEFSMTNQGSAYSEYVSFTGNEVKVLYKQ